MTDIEKILIDIINRKSDITSVSVDCPYVELHSHPDTKQHMGIELVPPFRYNCFICDSKGKKISNDLMDRLEISDETQRLFKKYMKDSLVSYEKRPKSINERHYSLSHIPKYSENDQLKYIESRYNKKFLKEDIERYKVILDGESFLLNNNRKTDVTTSAGDYFNFANAVGFITENNNQIVWRTIRGDQSRYYNMTFYGKNSDTSDYIIDLKNELSSSYEIVLTEGIFDIIGVYEHFYKQEDNSKRIFRAVLGKGYIGSLIQCVQNCQFPSKIIIYSDNSNDVKDVIFEEIKKHPYFKNIKIEVYKNASGKDFGVSLDKIDRRLYKIF